MNREIKTDLYNLLDLLNVAEDYGFRDDVLFWSIFELTGHVTDEEIHGYANQFDFTKGYGEEDVEAAIERLTEYRNQYKPEP